VSPAAASFLGATALHLGFQLTVTLVVYPALARAESWERAHAAHTRAITPLVVAVYAALVGSSAWVLVERETGGWVTVGIAGAGVSLLVTALVAGPAHGRLSSGRDPKLLRRLVVADLVRTAAALVAVVAAFFGVITSA
jgi:hypothetical protein